MALMTEMPTPEMGVLMAFLCGAGGCAYAYRVDRPQEDILGGCMFSLAAALLSGIGLVLPLSVLLGSSPTWLLVLLPAGMVVILGWASSGGMPLWFLLGLQAWVTLSYLSFVQDLQPGHLALLLSVVTAVFIGVSYLRHKFPWPER